MSRKASIRKIVQKSTVKQLLNSILKVGHFIFSNQLIKDLFAEFWLSFSQLFSEIKWRNHHRFHGLKAQQRISTSESQLFALAWLSTFTPDSRLLLWTLNWNLDSELSILDFWMHSYIARVKIKRDWLICGQVDLDKCDVSGRPTRQQ
jgi:hypothetical protein